MTAQPFDAFAVGAALRTRLGPAPSWAIVLGSGVGVLTEHLADARSWAYAELDLPQTGVSGHDGRLHLGRLGGVSTALLAGRVHTYEGHPADRVVGTVRAMKAWGVERILFTSAVGGLRADLPPGALVLINDHVNLMGRNPLFGPHDSRFGARFPDLADAYSPDLRARLRAAADATGVTLEEGVYMAMSGPSYETPAEVRMLGALGGTVVGMSLVPEVIAACQIGLELAAIAVVANPGAGLFDEPLRHEDVTRVVGEAAGTLARLIVYFLESQAAEVGGTP